MATTGGMHCTCSDAMAASCVLPPADAAGNWTPLLLLASGAGGFMTGSSVLVDDGQIYGV